jgi:hypothetical protein
LGAVSEGVVGPSFSAGMTRGTPVDARDAAWAVAHGRCRCFWRGGFGVVLWRGDRVYSSGFLFLWCCFRQGRLLCAGIAGFLTPLPGPPTSSPGSLPSACINPRPQGKEEVFEFLQSVLSEVVGLFPCQYVHIGGDECPKVREVTRDLTRSGLLDLPRSGRIRPSVGQRPPIRAPPTRAGADATHTTRRPTTKRTQPTHTAHTPTTPRCGGSIAPTASGA